MIEEHSPRDQQNNEKPIEFAQIRGKIEEMVQPSILVGAVQICYAYIATLVVPAKESATKHTIAGWLLCGKPTRVRPWIHPPQLFFVAH